MYGSTKRAESCLRGGREQGALEAGINTRGWPHCQVFVTITPPWEKKKNMWQHAQWKNWWESIFPSKKSDGIWSIQGYGIEIRSRLYKRTLALVINVNKLFLAKHQLKGTTCYRISINTRKSLFFSHVIDSPFIFVPSQRDIGFLCRRKFRLPYLIRHLFISMDKLFSTCHKNPALLKYWY